MSTTIIQEGRPTVTLEGSVSSRCPQELLKLYAELLQGRRLSWTEHHHLERQLGHGGQGVVYLSTRRGSDSFTIPVALKFFSPERYDSEELYVEAMQRIAKVASRVALIQQDNLLDVHNFIEQRRIRIMQMEWIDGHYLSQLLAKDLLTRTRACVDDRRWKYLNDCVVTAGPAQSRLKPGVAIAIVRECLAALAALHREGIVHGDIKPGNIMIKRTGNAKIIDIGSAVALDDPPPHRTCTPAFAAPEVLEGRDMTPQSDLASLGYVLVEMLSGQPTFKDLDAYRDLLEAKRALGGRLPQLLPAEVACNELLMNFIRRLVATDPLVRFASAEDADHAKDGAASFHRQLIVGGLASEYDNEMRAWLDELA